MEFRELEQQVKSLIAKDEMESAIRLLTDFFHQDSRMDDIIIQSGRYYKALKDQHTGIVSYTEINNTLNQLRLSILGLLRSEEEHARMRHTVFQASPAQDDSGNIPVFFSLGTPHQQSQLDYIEKLRQHMARYNIELVTLQAGDWNNMDPLAPIRKRMATCYGCLSLAFERSYVKEGIVKRGSKQESTVYDEGLATPWTHIETTLAYQLELPFLILKEKDLKGEGMLDENLFEWRIVKIDPAKPEELDEYPIKSFIRMWVEETKKFHATRHSLNK